MKKIATLLVIFLVGICANMQAQDQQEAWMEYMTPSEAHKKMAETDGVWKAIVSMWMKPDSEPVVSKGTMKSEMIFNGLYQRSTFESDFQGMPFQGESLSGYDNHKKKYFSTWIDTMGSGIMVMEGEFNEESQKLELRGKMMDPAGGKELDVLETFEYIDKDNMVQRMYIDMGGKLFKTMEIVYTRMDESNTTVPIIKKVKK